MLSRFEEPPAGPFGAPRRDDLPTAGLPLGTPTSTFCPCASSPPVGAYVRLTDRLGLSAGWRTTLDGRNTSDVDGYSVGFVLDL